MSLLTFFSLFFSFCSVFCKVYEIYNRDHFHDYLQDLPAYARYASVVAFYNETSSCMKNLESLGFNENDLPSSQYLFLGKYEMSTFEKRIWYEKEEHANFPKYIHLDDYINNNPSCSCPILVYFPVSYAIEIGDDYLKSPDISNIKIWDNKGNWKEWLWNNLHVEFKVYTDSPYNFKVTIVPHKGNVLVTNKPKTYTIDAIQSHTTLKAFVGDTIYISHNPIVTDPNKKILLEQGKNPQYQIFPDIDTLYLINLKENNQWGFNIGKRIEANERLIKGRHSTTWMTHTRNLVIPKILSHINSPGFTKLTMPEELHKRLIAYYRKWNFKRQVESWDDVGTQLNYFDIKTNLISLDHDGYDRDNIANDFVKPILTQWAINSGAPSNISLELTAFYGIREYARGACLRNHVDRSETHIFSVILQIAQSNVNQDWPVEVIGFDGKRAQIYLKPGEMALYEGGALIHGRPTPLNGTLFSNAFVHFKPSDWAWTTNQVWAHPTAHETLKLLHTKLEDIYK